MPRKNRPNLPNPEAVIRKVAQEQLGFEDLRPGQREAVTAVLQGHDTLAVQPTGSGKSAIYQIAGLMIDGPTVVISPLIALQKDQVDSIQDQNPAEAVALNSTSGAGEIRERMKRIEDGEIEYLFLAPEQLRKRETVDLLKSAGISLFVVDEAHCVSQWGHDFRPDYLGLGKVIEALGHPRVLALCATASPRVREEIVERLGMKKPKIFVMGFDRPNIYLRVDRFETEAEKRDALLHRVRWADKPGIVYVGTRKAAESIMKGLAEEEIQAVFYHAGLKAKDRERIHEQFMANQAEVIVATNAFGMGIDKPDVRFVYHYDAPDSLDAYYQEIGRGGRDGERAEAILFYRREDIGAQSYKSGEGRIEEQVLEKLAEKIGEEGGPVDPDEIAEDAGLSKRKLTSALQRLEDAGATVTLPDGSVQAVEEADPAEAARIAVDEHDVVRQMRKERLEAMRAYGDEVTACRRELLLRYFGDDFTGPCNFCDNCEAAAGVETTPDGGTRREVA